MSELRLALIVLGAVFLAAVVIWGRVTRRKQTTSAPEIAPSSVATVQSRPRRIEPGIEDFAPIESGLPTTVEMPTIHAVEPVRVEVMREVAVDVPGAIHEEPIAPTEPPAIRWPPAHTERVLSLRIARRDGQGIAGRTLRQAIESAGMVHGPQRIFHVVDAEGNVRASAANLVRPGSLDPEQMDAQEFRGLSLFCILPGPVSSVQMFDDLLQLARALGVRAEAEVQNEQGMVLAGQTLAQLRNSLLPKDAGSIPA